MISLSITVLLETAEGHCQAMAEPGWYHVVFDVPDLLMVLGVFLLSCHPQNDVILEESL